MRTRHRDWDDDQVSAEVGCVRADFGTDGGECSCLSARTAVTVGRPATSFSQVKSDPGTPAGPRHAEYDTIAAIEQGRRPL